MKQVVIPRHGKPEVLRVEEAPDPEPAPGEVRIRVRACGLNFAEVMARQGLYPDAPSPPMVVGYEVAGEVDALGKGVVGIEEGERVAALTRFGGHASAVCVPREQVFHMPKSMSFEDGAAIPVVYMTAHHMLFQVHRLREGESVLVHMAAGGVGTAALQLCRTVKGVKTYGTASAKKHEYVRSHGCDHPIDYRTRDYAEEIMEHTRGKGVDLVLDALGGPDWKRGYSLLRPGGMLVAFGWANMNAGGSRSLMRVAGQLARLPIFTPTKLMNDNRGLAGVNMGHMWEHIEVLRWQGEALMRLYDEGAIEPHVDAVYPFEQAAEAHRHLEEGRSVGKILLRPE